MERVRLAELCASTSQFTDLGTGQPVEHGLRTCLVAMRLADDLGLPEPTQGELFYVTLLRFLGCTADAHVVAGMSAGDEIRLFGGLAPVAMGSPREELAAMLGLVAKGAPLPRRLRGLARALTDPRGKAPLLEAHCEVAGRLAAEMGLPPGVISALEVAYARWDGRGVPAGMSGEEIPASVRVAIVARDIEVWTREAGAEQAAEVLRSRRGRAYDPSVVDVALRLGIEWLVGDEDSLWEIVLDSEPEPWREVVGDEIDRALVALGDFSDLKDPRRLGHSRRVASLVSEAARRARVAPDQAETIRRAALVHDLGMVAVPGGVIRGGPPGTSAEIEQLRLHPLWTQRILSRCSGFAAIAAVAGRHHERIDGSGYPAGVHGDQPPGSSLLACVETFDELSLPVGSTAASTPTEAAGEMKRLASEGAFSPDHVRVLLEVLEMSAPLIEVERPAELTEREVDVLALLSRGMTNREIAVALEISPKTVGTHVEHIYAKAGVRTRAAATLWAAQNSLV